MQLLPGLPSDTISPVVPSCSSCFFFFGYALVLHKPFEYTREIFLSAIWWAFFRRGCIHLCCIFGMRLAQEAPKWMSICAVPHPTKTWPMTTNSKGDDKHEEEDVDLTVVFRGSGNVARYQHSGCR
jgi:hypothetical protein